MWVIIPLEESLLCLAQVAEFTTKAHSPSNPKKLIYAREQIW